MYAPQAALPLFLLENAFEISTSIAVGVIGLRQVHEHRTLMKLFLHSTRGAL